MPNGKVLIVHRYTRESIRRNSNTLYVFGDNLMRTGFGGQAREARGEPNSVGIVTKISPSAYLFDMQVNLVEEPIVEAFNRLRNHLLAGNNIVWPADGVGTGLAALQTTGPLLFQTIEQCRDKLFESASEIVREP